jgi:hypothetical protein
MAGVEVGLREIMGFAALEKRIRALEQAFSATGKQCSCRAGEHTTYHSAEELKNLMDIRCPAHGFRDLGYLRWLPSGLPLQPDDQNLCSCPPCPVRELLQGRRGPLTDVEQEKEEQRWERECGPSSDKEFGRKQARVEQLLQKYEYNKRNRRRTNG